MIVRMMPALMVLWKPPLEVAFSDGGFLRATKARRERGFPNDWENAASMQKLHVSSCRERVRFSGTLCGRWWACNWLWPPGLGEGWAMVVLHALVGRVLWRRDRQMGEVAVAPCSCKGGWTAST